MKKLDIRTCLCALTAVTLIGGVSMSLQAQEEKEYPDVLTLDEIVVTAVPGTGATKLQSSVSVSDLSAQEIFNAAPRTTAEIFRNIPGIRSESSGGENNANIQVRGVPVTTGGAKFIQLQEDGLPVLSFGDITFGNADNFLRYDWTVNRVEAIRGGSASTFASNAPGAVINFISKDGSTEGGSVGITRGIDFDSTRVDFEYGGPINEDWQFHVGGFYRVGDDVREAGFDANEGGQIKFNLTRNFDNGFVRAYFKHLNDRTLALLPAPVSLASGDADPLPGFDFRDQAPASQFLTSNTRIDSNNTINFTDVSDGVRSVSTAFGAEFEFELENGWRINDKIRISENEGGFVGTFTDSIVDASTAAANLGGDTLVFVNGPNAGQTLTDLDTFNGTGLLLSNLLFDVDVNDLGQFVNDFSVGKLFELGSGQLDVTFGYYTSFQSVDTEWSFNIFLQELTGDAALIDVLDSTAPDGQQVLSVNGVTSFGVFDPVFDLDFDREALYTAFSWTNDVLTVDASVRYEYLEGTGASNLAAPDGTGLGGFISSDIDVNLDGFISPAETGIGVVDRGNLFGIDYDVDYVAYSIGINYLLADNLAVFGRWSRGGTANGDRLVLGGSGFNAAGGLIDDGIGVDIIQQAEFGVKYQGSLGAGKFSTFVTGFFADTEESNFEVTSGLSIDRESEAFGIELEGAYSIGQFSLTTGLTWTDAEITSDSITPANEGNTPRRQADLIYQLTPSFSWGDNRGHSVGINVVGTTDSFAQDNNDLELPGFAQINLFVNYEFAEGLTGSLNINNLNDAFGLTEAEEGSLPANGIVRARPIPGRSTTLSLRYEF